MVGSVGGGSDRSREVVGMMALHEALRAVCLNSDWTYSVFWTIRPRPRSRGGSGCKVSDENGSLMLMWEDGFCKGAVGDSLGEMNGEDLIRKAFSKMSIQLYNYGEGLMGKVASDKCHKWVFKEPSECEANFSNHWQSSFDALPPEWTDQFNSGIQTIAVIQAGHGLLQVGSCKIIPEDLHFVLRMRHTFESLGYQSGFYLSQLFSSTRSATNPSPTPPPKQVPPTPIFNWSPRPMPAPITTSFHTSAARIGLPTKDEHLFLFPQATDTHVQEMVPDHDAELKWPTGLSFFNALTGRTEDSKLLFGGMEALGDKPAPQHPFVMSAKDPGSSSDVDANRDEVKPSQEDNQDDVNKLEHKFQRSSTMPVTSSSTLDSHGHDPVAGIYSDMMETFLE